MTSLLILWALIFLAGFLSVELGLSAAIIEISLAVVYAVLVETGLTHTELGKIIMAATFVPDLGTAVALSNQFMKNRKLQHRLRVVAFAIITPFFFINGGMNISLKFLNNRLTLICDH